MQPLTPKCVGSSQYVHLYTEDKYKNAHGSITNASRKVETTHSRMDKEFLGKNNNRLTQIRVINQEKFKSAKGF